jgi:hypothetical protein
MATIHWKHPVNGDFAAAANWNPATVPGASDTAAIDAASLTAHTVSATSEETVKPDHYRHRHAFDHRRRLHDQQGHQKAALVQALARGRCYSLFSRPIFYLVVDGSAVVAMESRSKARWRTVAA